MENRRLLHLVDFERGVFVYEGKGISVARCKFPHHRPGGPVSSVGRRARTDAPDSFFFHEQREDEEAHMRCLFTYGGMYLVCNSNLLYHASCL